MGNPTCQGGNRNCHRTDKSKEKYVRHKRGNYGPREGAFSILEFSDNSRLCKKICHREKKQIWSKEGAISKLNEGG